jgi:hypothetical protein
MTTPHEPTQREITRRLRERGFVPLKGPSHLVIHPDLTKFRSEGENQTQI